MVRNWTNEEIVTRSVQIPGKQNGSCGVMVPLIRIKGFRSCSTLSSTTIQTKSRTGASSGVSLDSDEEEDRPSDDAQFGFSLLKIGTDRALESFPPSAYTPGAVNTGRYRPLTQPKRHNGKNRSYPFRCTQTNSSDIDAATQVDIAIGAER